MRGGLLKSVKSAPSTVKIALTYIISASLVLTGYYFARTWASKNRVNAMTIRDKLNEEFSIERIKEQRRVKGSNQD